MAALIEVGLAAAQSYPTRTIRFVVPFSAGGGGDMVARMIGQKLSERWNQPVVVDNRAGAGGAIGAQIVARSTPDGYTILLSTSSTHVIGPILQPDTPYDPVKDYSHITLTIIMPNIIVAHPSVGVGSIPALIQLAKARPGQLSFASNGTGTSSHIAGELLKHTTKIDITHVPYKGAGVAINDILGGHVHLLLGSPSTSLPHVRAGKLRALALTSLKRSAVAPDIPTVAEYLPGFEVIHWFGVNGPARMPKDVVTKLNGEIRNILDSADFTQRMVQQGLDVMGNTPEEFAAFLESEKRKFTKLFKEAGIRLTAP